MVVFQKSSRNRVQQTNKTPELEDSFSIDKPDNNRNPYLRPIEFQVKTSRRRWNYRSVAEERWKVETFSRVREEEQNPNLNSNLQQLFDQPNSLIGP